MRPITVRQFQESVYQDSIKLLVLDNKGRLWKKVFSQGTWGGWDLVHLPSEPTPEKRTKEDV